MRGKTRRSVIWLVAALLGACGDGASRDRLAAIFSTIELAPAVDGE